MLIRIRPLLPQTVRPGRGIRRVNEDHRCRSGSTYTRWRHRFRLRGIFRGTNLHGYQTALRHKRHLPPRLPLLPIPWARPKIHATPFRPRLIGRRIPRENESPPAHALRAQKVSLRPAQSPRSREFHSHELRHR